MHGMIKSAAPRAHESSIEAGMTPVEISRPDVFRAPIVFASPHSGRAYTSAFLKQSALDPLTLRSSEDAFVDRLFEAAPARGAPLVSARFPRAFVDANREPWELDPAMFDGPLPAKAKTRTPRVTAGLGVLPRIVADGTEIYSAPLPVGEAEMRIASCYYPYHNALEEVLAEARYRFGAVALIDCHSMPANDGGGGERDPSRFDFILGDRYGSSTAPALPDFIEEVLVDRGYRVARNAPYAGGYSTERYGDPARGSHAVQIEINRGLYLDQNSLTLLPNFAPLKQHLTELIEGLLARPDLNWLA